MAYEMVMPYHLHMPSYFLETYTECPAVSDIGTGQQMYSSRYSIKKGATPCSNLLLTLNLIL